MSGVRPVAAPDELRCLACVLDRHHQCLGDPCACTRHWPAQTAGDPFQLPFPRRERNREESA